MGGNTARAATLAANVLRHQAVPHQKGDKCGQRTDQDSHAPLQPELHGGQSSGRNSWPHRPQRTLASPAAPAGQVSPTRPPCSLAWPTRAGVREHLLTLGVDGAVSREQQRRPTCFGNKRGGWVGIPPERQQWRPTSFGSERCSDNGATIAASKRSQAPLGLYNRPSAATAFPRGLTPLLPMRPGRLSVISGNTPPTRPFRCQSTLAAGAPLEGLASPTRPPCRLAWPTRAGGREHFLTLEWVGGAVSREQQRRPTCFGRERSRRALYLQHALA